MSAYRTRAVSGRKAKASGKAAEKIFDQCAALWRRMGVGMFVANHPQRNHAGLYREKGQIDRVGVLKRRAVAIEIKHKAGQWPSAASLPQHEFEALRAFARAGAVAGVLCMRTDGARSQWAWVRIYADDDVFPNRSAEPKRWVDVPDIQWLWRQVTPE
jgi:hypothetical protein